MLVLLTELQLLKTNSVDCNKGEIKYTKLKTRLIMLS